MSAEENSETIERVRRYNLCERRDERDELRRVLAKIVMRKVTGKVEVDLSEGTPGDMLVREVITGTE
jgi:hypothetical protein